MDVPSLWNLFFQWSRRPHLSFVYERKSRFSPGWAQVAQSEDIYLFHRNEALRSIYGMRDEMGVKR